LITTAEAGALAAQGDYKNAAMLYARCTKPFEEVALVFVDQHEVDALRLYLTQKLANLGRNVYPTMTGANSQAIIQRTMISTWAIELFMDKLNTLEDSAANSTNSVAQRSIKSEIDTVRAEFQDFIAKHKVVHSSTHRTNY
jgi:vacuolar protein sorting-associated protein 18